MKKGYIKTQGTILECLPGTQFKVKLDQNDYVLVCHLSGKMRINSIRLIAGDRVSVEISEYDLTKGRICFREK